MTIARIAAVSVATCALLSACNREPPDQTATPEQDTSASAQAQTARPQPEAEPATAPEVAKVGQPAPDFTLTDTEGVTHELAKLRGKTVVLEWFNPDCPFVRYSHSRGPLKEMAARKAGEQLVWLAINSNAAGKQGHGVERNRKARADYAMTYPVLLDERGDVGRRYGAEKTPHMFVIDAKGTLVFRGGIDNAPMGEVDGTRPRAPGTPDDAVLNYVDAALEDLGQGRPLRWSDVPAYGCSVKYAS